MSIKEQGKLKSVCLLVTDVDSHSGGIQKHSRLLTSELNKRGITTYIICRNYHNLPRNEKINGTCYRRSPVLGNIRALNSLIYLIDTFFWLLLNRKKYDVIHCQQMFGPAMVAAISNLFTKKPILVKVTTTGELGEVKHIQEMPFARLRIALLSRINSWIALSKPMKKEIETLQIAPESVRIIHNSASIPQHYSYDQEVKKRYRELLEINGEKIGVFIGRLSSEKGLEILVAAWKIVTAKYKDAHLLILGEGGSYRNVDNAVRQQVRDLNLERNIHFLGHILNPGDYLLASDAFLLPSRTEGLSNSLVEAMASGATIVASDIEANQEICENEVNALLVQVGKERELAEAIIRVFDSPKLAEKLAREARKKAEQELSVQRMISSYIKAYQEILA